MFLSPFKMAARVRSLVISPVGKKMTPAGRRLESLKRRLKLDVVKEAGRQYPLFCFLLLALLLATVLLNRYLHVLMVFWSFLAGVVTFYCSLGPETLLPNFLVTIKPRVKQEQQELFPLGHSCAVCGKIKCKRHRPTLLLENYQPWLDLKVSSKVDTSLSEILELVLENFVYPWYRDLTDDEAFVDELRVTLRFFAAVLVRRAQKVDIPSLITLKLLKAAMKHIEIITKARQKVKNSEYLQQAALEEYGPDLHVALRSRRDELLYLRKLTEMLFPYILPPKATECRSLTLLIREVLAGSVFLPSMDYIADPDTVNHLLLIFIDNTPPEAATDPNSALVPFLQKYADPRCKKPSVLKLELKEIREQQDLLFRFMNFLKQEGAVHVLQFCLTVEEFNDKILCPELSDAEKLMLHDEVKKIYETYCLDESIDKIRFDPFIVEEIRNIAQGPYTEVVKLQTMRCLFEAYEHVLSLLENVFTPMFCHSDEYFRQLLRGAESPTRNSKLSRNSLSLDDIRGTSKRGESFGISRIGSKIKGVFKSTTMEGAMLPSYGLAEGEDDMVEEAMMVLEDDSPMEAISTPSTPRNLSAWGITIPYVDFYDDDVKKERIPVFCIDVERNDRRAVGHETEHWSVYRRYLEFYVLESKLTEFHGSFPDTQLPSKRIIGPKNYEFLTSKREEFQEYLQKLLQHPELSNSQLLADFLSPHSMESQFHDKMLPDVNLGKIIKSVPGKLIKEKGQHLEPFIQSFFNSCESPKPKPSRPELTILSPTSENDKKLFNDLYKNNANRSETIEKKHNQNYFMEMITVEGVYDYLMYVGRVVFHIPDWLHHLLMGGRILFKNTLEAYTDYCLHCKLDQVLQEHRIVSLITLLRDAVFCENSEPRSFEYKQKRAKKTFEEMMNYIPDFLGKCIGEEGKYEGIRLLFDGLQQPVLNKQLTYVLLDLTIQELFPDLNKVQKETPTLMAPWM
uniref:Sorting nexin-14 n=2 Tax=Denticeps clupeoides TaxID=299321 RepID=A0AAY4ASR9_9TELE